jgi:hypothetical protein
MSEAVMEAVADATNNVKEIKSAFDNEDPNSAYQRNKEKSETRTRSGDSVECQHCGSTIDKKTLRGSGNFDFVHEKKDKK